jgi:DNA-binding winged helix-turn-helix (wHTH) protein
MSSTLIPLGSYTLDEETKLLRGDRGQIRISPLSSRFLKKLAVEEGRTVSRSELINELWAGNYLVGEDALNRLASETRRAAKTAGSSSLIETVQKSGYRLYGPRPVRDSVLHQRHRERMLRWALWLFAFAVVVAGLNWLMETLIGLSWVSQHTE